MGLFEKFNNNKEIYSLPEFIAPPPPAPLELKRAYEIINIIRDTSDIEIKESMWKILKGHCEAQLRCTSVPNGNVIYNTKDTKDGSTSR